MPITRKWVAQAEVQTLRVDHQSRYIQMSHQNWQPLFGPDSTLSNSSQVVKLAGEFNKQSFDGVRLAAYLFNPRNGTTDVAASCSFRVARVDTPNWTETNIGTFFGAFTANSYFFVSIPESSLPGVDLSGGDTLLVEATLVRLGITYRDRVYLNHLGTFGVTTRLKNDVDFLDITKVDE